MCNISLEIGDKSSGKIWHRLHASNFKESPPVSDEIGRVLRVSTEQTGPNESFQFVSFGCGNNGEFIACSQSKLFYFSLKSNRFYLLAKLAIQPCALTWNKDTDGFALIGLKNGLIVGCSIGLRTLLGEFDGHSLAPSHIAIHPFNHLAASNSEYEAILWDLGTRTLKHKLHIQRDVPLIKVSFCGRDKLITTFKDNSIFVWDLLTLSCLVHLVPQQNFHWHYTMVAIIESVLVAGGSSAFLHVWDLHSMCFRSQFRLPVGLSDIQQIVGWTKPVDEGEHLMLVLLAAEGSVFIIDLTRAELISEIYGLGSAAKTASCSMDGNYLAITLHTGVLDVFAVDKLKQSTVQQLDCESVCHSATMPTHSLSAGEDISNIKLTFKNCKLLKHYGLLTKFGKYPSRHRLAVWKCLLCLPENKAAFLSLQGKGVHKSCCHLIHQSLLKTETLQTRLQKFLSSLYFVSPSLANVDYLPLFIFPFLKVFPDDELFCFEVVLTVLANWCQHWFKRYPSPPLSILSLVENLLALHDSELHQHFIKKGITAQTYAWPLLQTAFSEVCSKKEWVRLWDHLLSNHPSFIICVAAAFNRTSRRTLLTYSDSQNFQLFFHQPTGVDLSAVLEEAYRIDKNIPSSDHPRSRLQELVPLVEGAYVDPISITKLAQRTRENETLASPTSSIPTSGLSSVEFSTLAHKNSHENSRVHRCNVHTELKTLPRTQSYNSARTGVLHDTLKLRWRLAQTTYRRATLK